MLLLRLKNVGRPSSLLIADSPYIIIVEYTKNSDINYDFGGLVGIQGARRFQCRACNSQDLGLKGKEYQVNT